MEIEQNQCQPAVDGEAVHRSGARQTASRVHILEENDATQHYDLLQELGDCYCSVHNYDQARQCYEKAAVLAPDAPGPYVGLGVVAVSRDLLDDAEVAFKVACRLDKDCAKAYAGLAMVAQQRKDFKQAFDL